MALRLGQTELGARTSLRRVRATNETRNVESLSQHIDEDQALGMLDGTLTSSERAHIEKHVDTCAACRELLSDLAQQSGFHSKPSARVLPATVEFIDLALPLQATRHSPREASIVEVRTPEVKRPISTPPSPVVAAPPSGKTLWILLAVGTGVGLLAFALLMIVLGGAGLFYAGGRLVAEPTPEPFTLAAPPEPTTQAPPIAPLLNLPGVGGMVNATSGRQLHCDSNLGVIAHTEFTSDFVTSAAYGFQALDGCEVVLEDVTFRNGSDLPFAVIQVVGDESTHVTVRRSRVQGNVVIAGKAHVRFEHCTIEGTITGRAVVVP